VYSWGFGENYVLGNRDDCNEFKPYKLDPRMFEENKVVMLAGGTQHAVALSRDGSDAPVPVLNTSTFVAGEEVAGPVADEEDIEEEVEQPEVQ
jgi:alpha-tubulin suppressor-like RCC1 family protein